MEGKPHTEIHTCSVWVHTGKAFGAIAEPLRLNSPGKGKYVVIQYRHRVFFHFRMPVVQINSCYQFYRVFVDFNKKKKSSVENRKLTDLTWMDIELWANELSGLCWMLIKGWSFREALGHAYTWCIKFHRCVPLLEIVLLWRMIRTKEMAQKIKGLATKSDGLS